MPLTLAMAPVSIPPTSLIHGVLNVDCVKLWFVAMKTNSTKSPTAAATLLGLKTLADPPTVTY